MPRHSALLSILAVLTPPLCAALGDEPPAPAEDAPQQPRLHTVAREDLTLRATLEGRLEAATTHRVRLIPEAYTGPLHVQHVHHAGGAIGAGERILCIDPTRLEEELESAGRQLVERELKLEHARRELEVLEERHATQLAQRELALARAAADLELWDEHHGPRLLKSSELGVQQMESSVDNQREELEQLEQMYAGIELDSATKEIVLERARRSLAIALERLTLSRGDHHVTVHVTHPRRAEDLSEEARSRAEALAHLRVEQAIALEKKTAEIASLEVARDEARTKLDRLRGDLERLVVRAPADGLLARVELEPEEAVQARKELARIHDPSRTVLRVEATAAHLRVLRAGEDIDLEIPEYPEVSLTGTVKDISALGRKRAEETVFDVELEVRGDDPLLRLGLRATGAVERTLEGVLTVPRAAVTERDGSCFVTVDVDGEPVPRAVTLGPGDEDRVQVVRGLEAGERIHLPAEEAQEAPSSPRAESLRAPGPRLARASLVAWRSSESPAPAADDPERGSPPDDWRAAARAAVERGVDFLVEHQNADGSWGTFESRRPGEIYRGTVASFGAFRDASSALCVLALLEPSRRRDDAWHALDRGVEHLLGAEPAARATPTTFYGTWAHTYVLRAMARIHRDERFADRRERIAHTLGMHLLRLASTQGADGGWGYYDFGYGLQTPSGLQSNSFNSASILIALDEVRQAGFEVDPRMVRDGLRSLARLRLPSGVFIYGTGHRLLPGRDFNQAKGASARTQPSNLALFLYDEGVDEQDIARGLAHLRDHHHFLDIAYGRPRPHEAWYQNSGYYILYGHFYAATLIQSLAEPAREDFQRWQAQTLLRRQAADGSWFDFPMYGYHRAYGTAYAVMALQQHL